MSRDVQNKSKHPTEYREPRQHNHFYSVEITPRTRWGQALAGTFALALLLIFFLMFSFMVALIASAIALSLLIGGLWQRAQGRATADDTAARKDHS